MQTLECLITFEHDEGFSALFVGVGHRSGIGRAGVAFTMGVFDQGGSVDVYDRTEIGQLFGLQRF